MSFTDDVEFVAFDLETTGLSPAFCSIVELGAVRFRADGTELDRMERLVDPECPIPPKVTRIHGITDRMVRGCPTIKEVLLEFIEFLGGEDTIAMAHNALFDIGFISSSAAQTGVNVPGHAVVDTLELSRNRIRQISNHRLETVGRHFRVVDSTEHRALGDALVVKSVFIHLLNQRPRLRDIEDLEAVISPLYFETPDLDPVYLPAGYESLSLALVQSRPLSIVYDGGTKGRVLRQITPLMLIEEYGKLYVFARCHIDGTDKHFRLDRILEMKLPVA